MRNIEQKDVDTLLQVERWPAISIYTPVSRIGDQQDPIRYKNFLTQVEEELVNASMRTTQARNLLMPEYSLVKDADYWKNLGSDGLAVFLSGETVLRYELPVTFPELTIVGRRFHIRPLLPLLSDSKYLILFLNRNHLQLFQGDWHHLENIDLPEGTPQSMAEVLQYDEPERQLQYHTKTGSAASKRDAIFHGHGVGSDDQDHNLERYFQAIDRAIFPALEEEKLPIVLAGTEELHAAYRRITKGHTILAEGIAGSASEHSPESLRLKAREIAQKYYSKEGEKAVNRYRENLGSDMVVDDLPPLLLAAADGRVENLFIAENEQIWGEFDRGKRHVTVKDQADRNSVELLDEAVFWTLNTRGKVYIKKHGDMPVDTKACAQLRY